jgi:hypothetical protein
VIFLQIKNAQHYTKDPLAYKNSSGKRLTYKTWLYSKAGNPLIGEGTTLLHTFLSDNQR